jgi:hypothetical protein
MPVRSRFFTSSQICDAPLRGALWAGPSGYEKAVPAAVGILDRGLGTKEVAPGAESAVVIDEPGPLFGGHSFSLYITSGHVMVGFARNSSSEVVVVRL